MSKYKALQELMTVMANEKIHFEVTFEPYSENCFLELLVNGAVVFQTSDLIIELADVQGLVEQIFYETEGED